MVSKCNSRTKSLVFVRPCVFAITLNRNGKDKGSVYLVFPEFFLSQKKTDDLVFLW